ncbi:MAG: hypothetical protein KDC46_03720, partial [Thermoleophilia bacterium]|nr:hypothetical protein [Thermoleophilia bacterium]
MTPTTAAAASSLRSPYDPIVAGAPVDTSYEGPYSPGDAGAFVGDASTYGGGEVVSGGGDVAYRSADTSYVDDGGGAYYGTDATDAFSAVAGTQPAISNAPTATLDDLAALGIFRDDELQQLAQSDLSPEDLGALYDEAIRFMQSPEFNDYQLMLQQEQAAGGGDVPAGTAPANTDSYAAMDSSPQGGEPATWSQDQAPGSSEPAWNGEWNDRFQAALKDQGFDSKTRMMVTAQLRSLPLSESDLQQAFDYYTNTAEGRAELEQVDQQVRDGKATELKMTLGMGALALAGVAGTTALASSTGNLTHVLQRTAINGASDATKAAARAALREVTAGTLDRSGTIAREAASALRSEASATSRLFHPLRKAATNAAARNLTEASRLSRSDLVKYGLWMKQGDAVADVASSAVKAGGAAAEAG